jgi:UDP-N-acetylmuramate--alanine ligase
MCGIAELLHDQGYRVTGSDLREGPALARLRALGVDVQVGHEARHVGEADVLVYSSAVKRDNAEIREAEQRKIPVIPRAEMLGELMRLKDGIAVAGTHGKTTTTSLIAHVLHAVGEDPTAVIGGRVLGVGANGGGARLGRGDLLVAEADESDGSFLRLAPVIAVVTNIDPEHLEHYGSFQALEDAFVAFANRVPFWGVAIVCLDHPGVQTVLPRLSRRTMTYGFASQADLVASEVQFQAPGMRFRVRHRGTPLGEVRLRLPGHHNVQNALK